MTMYQLRDSVTNLEGPAAPPRKNGELVFDAPWESRAFGMAVALQGQGTYSWQEFSDLLPDEIAAANHGSSTDRVLPVATDVDTTYYEYWLSSLEKLLMEKGVVSNEELDARVEELATGKWDDHRIPSISS
jgi:nitrile hydratase accessory protein